MISNLSRFWLSFLGPLILFLPNTFQLFGFSAKEMYNVQGACHSSPHRLPTMVHNQTFRIMKCQPHMHYWGTHWAVLCVWVLRTLTSNLTSATGGRTGHLYVSESWEPSPVTSHPLLGDALSSSMCLSPENFH